MMKILKYDKNNNVKQKIKSKMKKKIKIKNR